MNLDRLNELDLEPEKMRDLESLAARLLDCQQERNKIAHAGWYPAMDGGQFVKDQATLWSTSMTGPDEPHQVTQERLKELFDQMHGLFWEVVGVSLDEEIRRENLKHPYSRVPEITGLAG